MNKKKGMALLLSTALLASAFTGCGSKKTESENTNQDALKWVIGGVGTLKDSGTVWDEFNKKLGEYLPDTKVDFEVIPYSDYAEKWKLMSASREKTDLVWVGWMINLYEEAQKGSLMELDDLLKETPDLINELPEYLFNLCKVNGKIYAVPNYQLMVNIPYGTKTQEKLAKKYGLDAEKITNTFNKDTAPTAEDYKVFEEYLAKLKAGGDLQKGVSPSFLASIVGRVGGLGNHNEAIVCNAVIDWSKDDLKVYDSLTDFPDKMQYYDICHDWYKKGYIRKDILSVQDISADENKENGYVLWSHSVFKGDSETSSKKHGFPIMSIPTFGEFTIPSTRPSTNTGISKTSENPEKGMKIIELMNTKKGKDLYNMLVYGLEGTHYKKIGENTIEWLGSSAPGTSSDNAYGYDNWVLGNTFNSYETQFNIEGWNDYIIHEVNEKATPSPLIGFTFNTENVKLEMAQYNSIMKEYQYVDYGANDNYKELIKERNSKLKKAGSDKIVEEVRKQVNEWKKNNK